MKNRLVLFVEGDGDVDAVPFLTKKLISEGNLWESVQLDNEPFRIGGVEKISGKHQATWLKRLRAALKRPNVAGILVVLDGDARRCDGTAFCAAAAARELVVRAKETGAGTTYSLAVVFACCEYETWLLAGLESLSGKRLPDGRPGVRDGTAPITGDLERAPARAKEALGKLMPNGYKPTLDQAELTKLLDLNEVRLRGLRSFARLESAIRQLCHACRTGQHLATPPSP